MLLYELIDFLALVAFLFVALHNGTVGQADFFMESFLVKNLTYGLYLFIPKMKILLMVEMTFRIIFFVFYIKRNIKYYEDHYWEDWHELKSKMRKILFEMVLAYIVLFAIALMVK